ncbi:MAG TPA: hypothetical protein VHT91_47340 [Kofleriaceae bacterium]|jgi:hypothetical protein|nr:hypothetical protein [Kofleriaceae bacterium]
MAATDETEHPGTPRHKHRHDLGQEDHGPKLAAHVTHAIQALLGLCIVLTLVLVVYALVDAARRRDPGTTDRAGEVDTTARPAPSGPPGR